MAECRVLKFKREVSKTGCCSMISVPVIYAKGVTLARAAMQSESCKHRRRHLVIPA